METDLKNQITVVIGGTKGIGYALASDLANLGATVCVCSRSGDSFEQKNLYSYKVDITNSLQVELFFKKIIKKFGRVDVLINAAGVFKPFGLLEEVSLKEHFRTLDINLLGSFRSCYFAIPFMKKQKHGRIILFSGGGVGGEVPLASASSYFVSKVAIASLVEVLSEELSPFNITINAILPGQILTNSTKATFKLSKKKLGSVLFEATKNLQKSGGNSMDSAISLIRFLLSKKGESLTGRLLSAKWDDLKNLEKNLPNEMFKLRRIEGKNYIKN